MTKRPRILERDGFYIFQTGDGRNVTLVRTEGETPEGLEGAYNDIQSAYEDKREITPGTYYQWAERLWRSGLEIDEADKRVINDLRGVRKIA